MSRTGLSTLLILTAFIALNLWVNCNTTVEGFLIPETEAMLVNYTDQRTAVQKIYDVKGTDWGMYQSRELSYAVDYLDYNLVAVCMKHHLVHFLSLSNLLGILIISLTFVRLSNRYLMLDPAVTDGLLALFLTSSCIVTSGWVLRSAKIGVGASVMVLLFVICRIIRGHQRRFGPDYLLVALLSLSAVLFDMQGIYVVAVLAVVLSVVPVSTPFPRRRVVGILAASMAFKLLYNYVIAPRLIYWINGYYPSFEYQTLPVRGILDNLPAIMHNGATLFLYNVKYLFGNTILIPVLIVVICFAKASAVRRGNREPEAPAGNRDIRRFASAVAICSGMFIVMNGMMSHRHRPLMWDDIQRIYYWIPVTVVMLFGAAVVIRSLSVLLGRRTVLMCLYIMIAGNLAAVPRHIRALHSGHLAAFIDYSKKVPDIVDRSRRSELQVTDFEGHAGLYIFMQRELLNNVMYRSAPPIYLTLPRF